MVRRVRDWWSIDRLVLLSGFFSSRIAYWAAGVRFDTSALEYSSQLLDQTLLRDRLFESVWYLHAQPPAFNLFVGFVLRVTPFAPDTAFHLAFLALGLVLVFVLHDLGLRLGLGRRSAVAIALVIGCAPTIVLYENWLSYEYPVAVIIVILVDLVARYAERPSAGLLFACTGVASLATLSRSLLHPAWLLAVFLCLLFYRWPPNRRAVVWGLLPLFIVALVMIKSQVLFASPQLSSWFGYNIHKTVFAPLRDAQRQQLVDEGFVPTEPGPCAIRHPDVPALADQYKAGSPSNGAERVENFNYECLINRYGARGADAVEVARRHPRWVMRNQAGAYEIWASPSSLTPFVFNNRNRIDTADNAYRRLVLLDIAWDPPVPIPEAWPVGISAPDRRFHLSVTLFLATASAILGAFVSLLRWRHRGAFSLAMIVGGGTVAFVTLAGNLFEYGENNRIRFIVEPLSLLLLAAVVRFVYRAWRGRPATAPTRELPTQDGPTNAPGEAISQEASA